MRVTGLFSRVESENHSMKQKGAALGQPLFLCAQKGAPSGSSTEKAPGKSAGGKHSIIPFLRSLSQMGSRSLLIGIPETCA